MTEQAAPTASDRTLRVIQGLLAQADDAAVTPEEAATFYAKAQELMQKYRLVEEKMLANAPEGQKLVPTKRGFRVCSQGSQFLRDYWALAYYTAQHAGVRIASAYAGGDLRAYVVGYEADCRYAEMLFVSAFLVFQENLEPQYDPNLSEDMNAFRLRNAGQTRQAIAIKLWGPQVKENVHAHQKVQKWYEAEANRRGIIAVSGRGVSRKDFIKVYVESFVSKFEQRLRRARDASDSITGALVFAGRAERIDEAFYEAFPGLRPSKAPAQRTPETERTEKQKAADERAWRRDMDKRRRLHNSPAGRAGWAAGSEAADRVELQGVEPAKRVES
jgi:hypothetical protein